jgi:mannitol/fructose-specific phosphotransferase system IIA component (Ntr-type)
MAYSHHIFFELPILTLGCSDKRAAIKELVDALASLQALPDHLAELVYRQLLDREDPPSFALYGYAMPHLSGELDESLLPDPVAIIGKSHEGIEWTFESKHNIRFTAKAHAILLLLTPANHPGAAARLQERWWDIAAEIDVTEFLKSDSARLKMLVDPIFQ